MTRDARTPAAGREPTYEEQLRAKYREARRRLMGGMPKDVARAVATVVEITRKEERLTRAEMDAIEAARRLEAERAKVEDFREELGSSWSNVYRIKLMVCKKFDIRPTHLIAERRTANVVYARQIAMYLCREFTPLSFPDIGRRFGDRDHTTVLHACRKVDEVLVLPDGVAWSRTFGADKCEQMRADIYHLKSMVGEYDVIRQSPGPNYSNRGLGRPRAQE